MERPHSECITNLLKLHCIFENRMQYFTSKDGAEYNKENINKLYSHAKVNKKIKIAESSMHIVRNRKNKKKKKKKKKRVII